MWEKVKKEIIAVKNKRNELIRESQDAMNALKLIEQPNEPGDDYKLVVEENDQEVIYVKPGCDRIYVIPAMDWADNCYDCEKNYSVDQVKSPILEKIIVLATESEPTEEDHKKNGADDWNDLYNNA